MRVGISLIIAETYGPGSRCVEHASIWTASNGLITFPTPFQQSGCYRVIINNKNTTIIYYNFSIPVPIVKLQYMYLVNHIHVHKEEKWYISILY